MFRLKREVDKSNWYRLPGREVPGTKVKITPGLPVDTIPLDIKKE